jgi:nicotinamide-nucleotide amidase
LSKRRECIVEIISVGNELLLGNTINTNASWIATKITENGGRVTRITTVPDELDEIVRSVREALGRKPDYVITTGGIGPTFDDMTIKAVARSVGQRLKVDPVALEMVKQHYLSRFPGKRVKLTKARLKMATIPVHGNAVSNPVGTAPAVRIKAGKTEVYCLPGVPSEAKAIFKKSISDQIRSKAARTTFVEKWVGVTGVMESALAPLVERTMGRWPNVYVKSHPRGFEGEGVPHIELHLSSFSSDIQQAQRELKAATEFLVRKLHSSNARLRMRR